LTRGRAPCIRGGFREEEGVAGAAVIIPARLESERLPRKLLLAETGRPLLAHTVERVLEAKEISEGAITRVIVAADDEALLAAARKAGAEAVLTSPEHRSGTDRIAEAAWGIDEPVVVNVQGDEAEIEPDLVLAAARVLDGREEPMGTLAYPIRDRHEFTNPNLVKVVTDREGRALYFSRSPVPHAREGRASDTEGLPKGVWGFGHMGVYVYRREFLLRYSELPPSSLEERESLEQLRALEAGAAIRVEIVGGAPSGRPIDTREDYEGFRSRFESGSAPA
jgi:3-deoxy-manno-octulosonate cytidylyltransferase (CMP-KDO synthetase)